MKVYNVKDMTYCKDIKIHQQFINVPNILFYYTCIVVFNSANEHESQIKMTDATTKYNKTNHGSFSMAQSLIPYCNFNGVQ